MSLSLINPADSVERQNEKLMVIVGALMRRVEQKSAQSGLAYRQFERAALLESDVRERTRDLERTLDLLQDSNQRLELSRLETESARRTLAEAIETIDEGFGLFDAQDRLALFNSRFCQHLPDVRADLRLGMDFNAYVKRISRSRGLDLPPGQSSADWAAERLRKHRDQRVVFNVALHSDLWLQVSEHRTSEGGTVILQTDVSDLIQVEREAQDRLRDEQARILQATLDHLNQGVCIFDNRLKLRGWNSKIAGFLPLPQQRISMGMDFVQLLDGLRYQLEFRDGFDADRLHRWAARKTGRLPIAFEIVRADRRIFSAFAQEMPDKGFVISFTDVTMEREAAETLFEMNEQLERRVRDRTFELGQALAEAERANATKSRFVAAASHDLLQPLSAAKLFVSSLTDRLESDEMRGVLRKAESALLGAQQIIEALLDISKLDSGKFTLKQQTLHLSDIFDPLQNELAPVAQAKGLDLRMLDCSLTVRSDPAYLRRIVQNLLTNAIRYTDQGRILVGVRRIGDMARIEVWDTGRGIPHEDQSAIFQEFHRLHGNVSEGGLGLGLAIVERACNALGHPLSLWSEPGRGSCFSLGVPIATPDMPNPASDTPPLSTAMEAVPGTLTLLVENDDAFAAALSMVLESMGGEVLHVHSGEEALTLLEDIQLVPDALLLDYQLGKGMTGTELYRVISARYGAVHAAIVSADRTLELRRMCKALDLPLLSKPVDKARLQSFVAQAAQKAGL